MEVGGLAQDWDWGLTVGGQAEAAVSRVTGEVRQQGQDLA